MRGERLKDWAKSMGFSTSSMASVIEYSRSYVDKLYKGEKNLSLRVVDRIVEQFPDFPVCYVLYGVGTLTTKNNVVHTKDFVVTIEPKTPES